MCQRDSDKKGLQRGKEGGKREAEIDNSQINITKISENRKKKEIITNIQTKKKYSEKIGKQMEKERKNIKN